MKPFTKKTFNLPELKGISKKSIEEHIKLYEGYVTNANKVTEKIAALAGDFENNSYVVGELGRRFSFEFNGMRNHEVYFESLSENSAGGAKELGAAGSSALKAALEEQWGSFETFLSRFKNLALTRGIGWSMLYYDRSSKQLVTGWVDEQHLGQLQNCELILGLDMWEHSYVADYQPSGKKQYVEDFFANLNWSVIEENFKKAN